MPSWLLWKPLNWFDLLIPRRYEPAPTGSSRKFLTVPEFERRQIEAVRRELDAEYEAADTTSPAPRKARPVTGISSSSRS